jgi:protein-S-isoprenylcysteine O-methyltransferase Ste14
MPAELSFRLLVAAVLAAFVGHRAYYTRRLQRGRAVDDLRAQGAPESPLGGLAGLVAFASTLVYLIQPDWIQWAQMKLPAWSRVAGLIVALGGFTLLQWSQATLGSNWSDEPRLLAGQGMVAHGAYQWIRHPIYAAFLLILGSPMLLSANWLVGGSWIAMVALDVRARITFEERLMLAAFGEKYQEYMDMTGAMVPHLRLRRNPNE